MVPSLRTYITLIPSIIKSISLAKLPFLKVNFLCRDWVNFEGCHTLEEKGKGE